MVPLSNGVSLPPQRVGKQLHGVLAALFCPHRESSTDQGCKKCYLAITSLVKPVARALVTAGMFERKTQFDGFVAIGRGVGALMYHLQPELPDDMEPSVVGKTVVGDATETGHTEELTND